MNGEALNSRTFEGLFTPNIKINLHFCCVEIDFNLMMHELEVLGYYKIRKFTSENCTAINF